MSTAAHHIEQPRAELEAAWRNYVPHRRRWAHRHTERFHLAMAQIHATLALVAATQENNPHIVRTVKSDV